MKLSTSAGVAETATGREARLRSVGSLERTMACVLKIDTDSAKSSFASCVGSSRLPVRWNREKPSLLSSRFSCPLTLGWEMPRSRAVSMVVPTRISVPNSSSSLRSIINPVIVGSLFIIIRGGGACLT